MGLKIASHAVIRKDMAMARRKETDTYPKALDRGARRPALKPEHVVLLCGILLQMLQATPDELAAELEY